MYQHPKACTHLYPDNICNSFCLYRQSHRLTQIHKDHRENIVSCGRDGFTSGLAQTSLCDHFEHSLCMEVVQKGNREITASSTSAAKSAVAGTPKKWAVTQRGERCNAKALLYYPASNYVWSKSCITLTKSNLSIATWVLDKRRGQNPSPVLLYFPKQADPLGTGSLLFPAAVSKLPQQGIGRCTMSLALGNPIGFIAALLFWGGTMWVR